MSQESQTPFDPGYFHEEDLRRFGFKNVGKNVSIAKNCTIIGVENISIGDYVRIDGYTTILTANNGFMSLGSFIHIGGHSFISASEGVVIKDFTSIAQGLKIYTKSDDYTGIAMTGPNVPPEYTHVHKGEVTIDRHCVIGANAVILPSVNLDEGVAIGAQSLITKSLESWGVYCGIPVRKIQNRSKKLLEQESKFLNRDKTSSYSGIDLD